MKRDRPVPFFDGLPEIICTHLGVRNFRTKTAALELAARNPFVFSGEQLVRALFERLDRNWSAVLPGLSKPPSSQNFRWCVTKDRIDPGNTSPEVTLERALIHACINANRKDWSNQVPLISGIAGPRAYKRGAIDLVHRDENGGFEFIELKIRSGTPLYAAMEILLNGLLWLLSRRDRHILGYRSNPILDAPSLQLSVLAPKSFYDKCQCKGLPAELSAGLSIVSKPYGAQMSFRQLVFPYAFQWPSPAADNSQLLDWLDRREII